MRITPFVTETERIALHVQAHSIAIGKRFAGERVDFRNFANLRALQRLAQDGNLHLYLRRVRCVLIMTAAAFAEVGAGRGHAVSAWHGYGIEFRSRVAAFIVDNVRIDLFAGERERHEDGLAFGTSKARAAVDRLLDAQFHAGPSSWRM